MSKAPSPRADALRAMREANYEQALAKSTKKPVPKRKPKSKSNGSTAL